jgi:hypothetical protein
MNTKETYAAGLAAAWAELVAAPEVAQIDAALSAMNAGAAHLTRLRVSKVDPG